MLALHAGMRNAEIRGLQWGRVDLSRAPLQVSDGKTKAGEGRVIPLNSELLTALADHSKRFLGIFGEIRTELYLCNACKGCRSTETIVG
jgi:integrase